MVCSNLKLPSRRGLHNCMESFPVELGANSHQVFIGQDLLARAGELALAAGLQAGPAALITDATVGRLYSRPVLASLESSGFIPELIEILPGEPSKSLDTLERIY